MQEAVLVAEVTPLVFSKDVAALADWVVATLGLTESWRAPGEDGQIEHAELHWLSGKISINLDKGLGLGPVGIGLRVDDRKTVEQIFERARAAGADIVQGLEESRVSYSFTVRDPGANQWWVNAETGFLDEMRQGGG